MLEQLVRALKQRQIDLATSTLKTIPSDRPAGEYFLQQAGRFQGIKDALDAIDDFLKDEDRADKAR